MPLTDTEIRALKPRDKLFRASDGGGLMIEVAPSGAKKFRIAYRFAGKQHTLHLGDYPGLKLARARYLREQVKHHLSLGQDPKAALGLVKPDRAAPRLPASPGGTEAQAPAPEEETFRRWLAAYIDKRAREGAAPKTLSRLRRHEKVLDDHMGGARVSAATAQDVIRACRHYENAGKFESARAVRALASQVFRFAVAHGAASTDPATTARDALTRPRSTPHAAVTDPREVGRLMRAIRRSETLRSPVVRAGLLLSAYLAPRNGQLRHMRWDQIEDAMWTIPADQMKMKRDHLVPLPRQARDVLDWIRPITGHAPFVLASGTSRSGILSDGSFNVALDSLGYDSTTHRHHGFRTTFSTVLNEQGWSPDWIEMQLAHVERNKVRAAYNKALYINARIEMMQAYADWLDVQEARG